MVFVGGYDFYVLVMIIYQQLVIGMGLLQFGYDIGVGFGGDEVGFSGVLGFSYGSIDGGGQQQVGKQVFGNVFGVYDGFFFCERGCVC